MFSMKSIFYFTLLHLIFGTPQINLLYTDWVSESESDNNVFQHDCLRLLASIEISFDDYQIISYCMSESSSKFNIENENDNFFPQFTFGELSKQNITSQQLYLWSAPIDIIERYQFYLNQLNISNDLSLAKEVFYNCTMPRFGPMCQYELDYDYPDHLSLYEIIRHFYNNYPYNPTNMTCYMHLQCNRGPFPSCLDWSEICDGKIDCLDGAFDEENCWELEINECKDNEYRCMNGQCIPQSFHQDNSNIPDCFDGSDEIQTSRRDICHKYDQPSIGCEDVRCENTPLTKSCMEPRMKLLVETMYSNKDSSISKNCWSAFKCMLEAPDSEYPSCNELCKPNTCIEIVKNTCPDILYFPSVPVLFGDIYFAYPKNDSEYLASHPSMVLYICYNKSHYDDFFVNTSKMLFNNKICVDPEQFLSRSDQSFVSAGSLYIEYHKHISKLYGMLKRYHLIFNYTSEICNKPNVYRCVRSLKCISIHRLMDTIYDCPHMDDENTTAINNTDLIEQLQKNYFKCQISNKSIHPSSFRDEKCDCETNEPLWCEDENMDRNYIRKNISFQTICDGFIELAPVAIDRRNETDETECEQWECNNIYTHCNGLWNCPNGADENNCISYSTLNCSSNHYSCVSSLTNQFMCLPIEKINDGNVDCLGATDEQTLCRENYEAGYYYDFYCRNQSSGSCVVSSKLCDNHNDCDYGDDEQFCETNQTSFTSKGICIPNNYNFASNIERLLCDHLKPKNKHEIVYFTLDDMDKSIEDPIKKMENPIFSSSSTIEIPSEHEPRCHRGLDLRVWLNNENNLTTNTCLCPPSFYGDQCQYQNQRISLAIGFRALSDSWQTLFAIVISLIDDSNERIIHSYEQFTYLSVRDCKTKFNINLLYATRPKDASKHYAIHVDIYEKVSLAYRGSLWLPVIFPFLPVYRLAFIADIPRSNQTIEHCSNDQCVHGKCIKYSNNPQNVTFCRCDQGWSGQYCTIPHTCMCSNDSLYLDVSANNRSICVCPIHKFGSRCFLIDTICQTDNNSQCQNGGKCVPNDDFMISDEKFVCVCPKGFSGNRCEFVDNKLILSFEKNMILPQSIFIHFIEINFDGDSMISTIRSTTFRTIPLKQDSMMVNWSQPFHLVFIEFFNSTYYLTVLQKTYNRSTTIVRMLNPSDRCPHISELFNETFIEWHLLRRIKYYHLPCQKQSLNLSCFYDDVHLCLCYDYGEKRLANCFNFDHNMTFDCFGQSVCENGGQCLQDTPNCPTKSICICPACFYGTQCQFSTNGFGLSLDAILGYRILPEISLNHQPFIIKMSLALTIIFIVTGLINGILSIITFKNKSVREFGCGLYLLGSSITTLLTTLMFGLKFWILILAQTSVISNKSFLSFQCHSIDFLLRVCLCMDQWLNACVAVERAFTAIKGARFDKKKSKQTAKFVIIIILISIVGTSIHDPIYRHLIDEINDDDNIKRIWCTVSYQPGLQLYNSIMHTFHFSVPFMMNLISAVILIIKQSRQQATTHPQQNYRHHLREQFRQHKHLLTAPIVLVILALPRLIISFTSKCMKSSVDSWLFLVGYFISFTPPMLTFVVFILPSKFYKKEFRKSIVQYRTTIQRRLRLISDN